MARTALTPSPIVRTGLNPSYVAANVDGHSFENTGREFIHIKNGGVGSINATVVTPGSVDGLAIGDRVVAVPAGEERIIGPLPRDTYNQPGTSDVYVDFSAVTSVTVAVFRL